MGKVFVVTAGDRSDYGVLAVFTTRELAKAYIADNPSGLGIEEYDLDPPPLVFFDEWTARLNRDGKLLDVAHQKVTAGRRHDERGWNLADYAKRPNSSAYEGRSYVSAEQAEANARKMIGRNAWEG